MTKLLLLAALGACAYDARYEDCAIRCSTATGCPDGFSCGAEGLCRAPQAPGACDSVVGPARSCTDLPQICGSQGTDDCCSTALPIPGGMYYRSYDVASDGMYPSIYNPATVSAFLLDKYEVTVGRFRKFVEAGGGTQAAPPLAGASARRLNELDGQGGWNPTWNADLAINTSGLVAAIKCDGNFQSWTDAPGANETLPINCVSWYEAFAFCTWDGGFLPTEAEWNFAATGGGEQRAYPWSTPAASTVIDCTYANYNACGGLLKEAGISGEGSGRWGHADLAGNVWEWTLDWYEDFYRVPCDDCSDLIQQQQRVFRGGGFLLNGAQDLRASRRFHGAPESRATDVGIRCARPAQR